MEKAQHQEQSREIPDFLRKPQPIAKRAPLHRRVSAWIKARLDLASMSLQSALFQATMKAMDRHDSLITGLRADLEATQEQTRRYAMESLALQGEIMRIEHYLDLYRDPKRGRKPYETHPSMSYELQPIQRSLRRTRSRRAG